MLRAFTPLFDVLPHRAAMGPSIAIDEQPGAHKDEEGFLRPLPFFHIRAERDRVAPCWLLSSPAKTQDGKSVLAYAYACDGW